MHIASCSIYLSPNALELQTIPYMLVKNFLREDVAPRVTWFAVNVDDPSELLDLHCQVKQKKSSETVYLTRTLALKGVCTDDI